MNFSSESEVKAHLERVALERKRFLVWFESEIGVVTSFDDVKRQAGLWEAWRASAWERGQNVG